MIVLTEDQRSPEWFAARRGKITASEAHKCLMGKNTKGRRQYVEKLADDLEGIPDFDEHDIKPWFVDGMYYESWARGWYSFKYDVEVTETGLVVHDDYQWIGHSPDGLIGTDGEIEIKYRKSLRTFTEHAEMALSTKHKAQMQTGLFVTGRDWCDYVNYWRFDDLEKGHVQRVYRDDAYINNTLLPAFLALWDQVQEEIKKRKLQPAVSSW